MLSLYNTLTKTKEEFKPKTDGKVTMYTCGPTVYGNQHIGNYRSLMTADILRRYLEFVGFEVAAVCNITDVGHLTDDDVAQGDSGSDKLQLVAERERKSPYEIAQFYERAFLHDAKKLNLRTPFARPRATEHIAQMIEMIEQLIANGHAYESGGNVFFDVTTFADYGKLSGNTLEDLKVGARLSDKHPDKRNQWDFALWLAADKNHIMRWQSPWSTGYPGWHIECSAMCAHYLDTPVDIHTGGEDNIFPHHEAEIAQSECAGRTPFVNYWIHTRHMLIDGTKMSKSKGNIYTLDDIREKGFTAEDLRICYFGAHYRSQMNFTWDALAQGAKNRTKITQLAMRLRNYQTAQNLDTQKLLNIDEFRAKFTTAMDDDLNTPLALSATLELTSRANALMDEKRLQNPEAVYLLLEQINSVLGLDFAQKPIQIPEQVHALAAKRQEARQSGNFDLSDQLRDQITTTGYEIKDTPEGYELRKL